MDQSLRLLCDLLFNPTAQLFSSAGIVLVLSEAVLGATALVLDCGGEAR